MNDSRAALVELLEAEKAALMARFAEDRSPQAAREAMEKTLDRVSYRYVELCDDPKLAAAAQAMLASTKASLPVVESVNEAHEWKRALEAKKGLKLSALPMSTLLGGGVLTLAGVLGLYFTSGRVGAVLGLLKAVVPALLGGGLMFFSGTRAAAPSKAALPEPEVRKEFLVDGEAAWHALRNAMVVADGELETLRERAAVEALDARADRWEGADLGPLTGPEAELLSGLLETAYFHRKDPDAAEMISEIRFYLHGKGVEVTDYTPENARWFELLPAPEAGTMRPALVKEGRALRKGLASAGGPAAV